jgi:hypothetical protein
MKVLSQDLPGKTRRQTTINMADDTDWQEDKDLGGGNLGLVKRSSLSRSFYVETVESHNNYHDRLYGVTRETSEYNIDK